MQLIYNGTILAPGGVIGEPFGIQISQRLLVDAAFFFRATIQSFFARGNLSTDFGFRVKRQFQDILAAQIFCTTHANALPGQGTIIMIAGDSSTGTQQINLQGATLDQVALVPNGVEVEAAYSFHGGNWDTQDLPVPDGTDVMKRSNILLNIGDTFTAWVFDQPFGTPPAVIQATVAAPSGGAGITATPDLSTMTAAGVTIRYNGVAIPDAGYRLMALAIL